MTLFPTSKSLTVTHEEARASRRFATCMLLAGIAILSTDVASAADIKSLGADVKGGTKWLSDYLTDNVVKAVTILLTLSGGWMLKSGMSMDKIAAVGGSIVLLNTVPGLFA